MSIVVESSVLTARVSPRVGGAITEVTHKPSGLSVLGRVPWAVVDEPLPSPARDEAEWLTRYTGGWPPLFPNAGDACTVDGVFHGFHGEASISEWQATSASPSTLLLTRNLASIPVQMRRAVEVSGETLSVREEITFTGEAPMDVMWSNHPTFGSDLLDGPVEITTGARRIAVEPSFAPPAGADLMHPAAPLAALAYLMDFEQPWAMIRRLDNAIAIRLDWDGACFPCAWLWEELEGTAAAPYAGRTRLIAIEPSTTPCGLGLQEAKRGGASLLRLAPGQVYTGHIALRVFQPNQRMSSA